MSDSVTVTTCFSSEVPAHRSSLHLDKEYLQWSLKKKRETTFCVKNTILNSVSNTACMCLCRVCLYAHACVYAECVCMHMHVFMKGCSEQRRGRSFEILECWCSPSDAEDILQPAFFPDLSKGRRRICVILRVRYLSNKQALFCNTFLRAV